MEWKAGKNLKMPKRNDHHGIGGRFIVNLCILDFILVSFKKYFNFTKNIIHKATITHYDVYANKQYFQCAQNNENVM